MAKVTDKRWKGHLINWLEIADMDGDEYQLKPLNQQQVAILLMLLEYQKWETRWTNLELSKEELHTFIGEIEYRLMLNGGDGGDMSIDYDLLGDKVCEAIECGFERVAARYLSGTVENLAGGDIVIGPGATPVVVPPGQAPDDPSTSSDEEARSGGAQSVYLGFKQLILDLNAYIVQGLSDADIYTRIKAQYKVDPDMAAAIAAYHASFDTPPPSWTTPVITSGLASRIYCKGNTVGTISNYIIQTWDAEVNDLLGIASALPQSQLDLWFNAGKIVPSSDYLAFSCVKIVPYEFTILANPETVLDTHTLKKYHRYEIDSSGYWQDAGGSIQDTWWTKNYAASENFSTILFNITATGAPKVYPTVFECPFDPTTHKYRWTMDIGASDVNVSWGWGYWGGFSGAISSPTGGIEIKVKDLGEYV